MVQVMAVKNHAKYAVTLGIVAREVCESMWLSMTPEQKALWATHVVRALVTESDSRIYQRGSTK